METVKIYFNYSVPKLKASVQKPDSSIFNQNRVLIEFDKAKNYEFICARTRQIEQPV